MIMDTFLRCLQKKSYFETTIRDVAKEAGVAPGLIYYYFENKEKLLLAVFHQAMEHCLKTVDKYFEGLSGSIHDESFEQTLVRFLVEYYGGQGWEECAAFNALWALAQYNAPLKQAMHDSYVEFESEVYRLLQRHLDPEVDAVLLSRLIIIILDGIVIFSTIYQSSLRERVDFMRYATRIFAESAYLKHPSEPLPEITL